MRRSGETSPRSGVMTSTDGTFCGGCANARAYASLPRKYKPLRKLNASPTEMPPLRSATASGNAALSLKRICARRPKVLAGDNRNIRRIQFFVARELGRSRDLEHGGTTRASNFPQALDP